MDCGGQIPWHKGDQIKRVHPEDREFVINSVDTISKIDDEFDLEFRIVRPGGEIRFIHVRDEVIDEARPPGVSAKRFGTIADVTETKIVEEALRKSEERMRRYFDAGLVWIVILNLDKIDKKFLRTNDTCCKMTGYLMEELLTMTINDVSHPDDIHKNDKQWEEIFVG